MVVPCTLAATMSSRPASEIAVRVLPALALALALGLLAVLTKGQAALGRSPDVSFAVLLRLCAHDLALAGGWLLAAAGVLAALPKRLGPVLRIGHAVAGATVLVLIAVAHGFWMSTGSTLDFPMVAYTWSHIDMLGGVVASEVQPGAVVALLVLVALPVATAWLPRLQAAPRLARLVPVAAVVALVGLAAPWWAPSRELPGPLQPLRGQPVVQLAVGAWKSATLPAVGDQAIAAASRPVQPLIVRRTERTRPYNVILFGLESARASALTTYNSKRDTMPFLDSLARTGLVVERAYTSIPHTTKSLVPMHCGIYPKIASGFDESTPGAMPGDCLARVLRRQGYATAYLQASEAFFERQGDLVEQYGFEDFFSLEDMPTEGFEVVSYFGLEDKAMLGPTFDWLDAHADQPFFLGYITLISHHYYGLPSTWKVRQWAEDREHNAYLNALRYTDELLADLAAGLKKRGRLKDTLFVFVGDHGEGFGEHGLRQHDAVLYEEGVRVPFILHGAGIEASGRRLGGLRNHVDIMPTVLDVLGLDVVAGTLDGTSVLKGAGHAEMPLSCWYQDRCIGMLQQSNHSLVKTIWHYGHRQPEVFDLVRDPDERVNLFGQSGHTADQIDARVQRLHRWKEEVNGRYAAQASRRRNPWVRRQRPEQGTPCAVQFDDVVRLVSTELEPGPVKAGEAVWATYVFEVLRPPPTTWRLFVHAEGPAGALEQADHVPVEGSYPIARWQPGEFIIDRNYIRFDPGNESGRWRIALGFWDEDSGDRAVPSGSGLKLTATRKAVIGTVEVVNADRPVRALGRAGLAEKWRPLVHDQPPVLASGPTATAVQADFGDFAQHLWTSLPAGELHPGQKIELRHVFRVIAPAPLHTQLFVHLNGPQESYLNATHVPVSGQLPPERWRPGEFVEDRHEVTLPADWPAGRLTVKLGFWNPEWHTERQRAVVRTDPSATVGSGAVEVASAAVSLAAPNGPQ